MAKRQSPALISRAREQSTRILLHEIDRLRSLARINPNVRAEEIEFMEMQLEALTTALDSASFRLDALRVVVAT